MYMKLFSFALEFMIIGAVLECMVILVGYVIFNVFGMITRGGK